MSAAAQGNCIRQGETISGTLREVRRQHASGAPIRALQIDLGRQACIEGAGLEGGRLSFRRVHVVPIDESTEAQLRRSLGRRVAVRGREIMETHTAWHVGDAVMFDASIVGR
jgi:hypothetical protein